MSRPYGVADERFDEAGFEVPFAGSFEGEALSESEATFGAESESPFAESTFEAEAFVAEGLDSELREKPTRARPCSRATPRPARHSKPRTQAEAEQLGYDETLAWLDVEAADGNAESLGADDFAPDGETLQEDEHEPESLSGETERETEYLDDEGRDASESYGEYALQERFELEDEPAGSSASTLTAQQRAWILALDRTAIERLPDAAARTGFLQQDWSDVEFPGNVPKGQSATNQIKRHWALARSLFNAMAGVVPERRVPTTIRFRDRPVVEVPGQPTHRLFAEARDAFVRMREAATADGVDLVILSSWRSRARQAAASANQPNPAAVARKASAHMYGLAIDLRMGVPGLPVKEINTRVDRATAAKVGTTAKMGNLVRMYRSPVYKWMSLRAREFGWYPYRNEPWHWEYNPPGLKARFEGATRGELEQEGQPEAEYEEESETLVAVSAHVHREGTGREGRRVRHAGCTHRASGRDDAVRARPGPVQAGNQGPARHVHHRASVQAWRVGRSDRPTDRAGRAVPGLGTPRCEPHGVRPKWHRLAQPATFNQVAAEALEQARAITGSAAPSSVAASDSGRAFARLRFLRRAGARARLAAHANGRVGAAHSRLGA